MRGKGKASALAGVAHVVPNGYHAGAEPADSRKDGLDLWGYVVSTGDRKPRQHAERLVKAALKYARPAANAKVSNLIKGLFFGAPAPMLAAA